MLDRKYLGIVAHYERCLETYGDHHLGVDWADARAADTRYQVMLDVVCAGAPQPVNLLDFGCGAAHLLDFIVRNRVDGIAYTGLDISPAFVALSRRKYPGVTFHCANVLEDAAPLPAFDYVVMNGVFTEKRDLSNDEMYAYLGAVLERVCPLARAGLAFNVMSAELGWEQPFLFHAPVDRVAALVRARCGGDLVIRADYGLADYTVYVYR